MPTTEYGRAVANQRAAWTSGMIEAATAEVRRVWLTMTDEQKAAEPIVLQEHLNEARDAKKSLATSGALKCPVCGNPCVSFEVVSALGDPTSEITTARCRLGHEWLP